ncbi:MAG: sulfur-oxidizing protein SoxY [Arenicella sp.]|jgi:sulfur-oxidizing protein SoxY
MNLIDKSRRTLLKSFALVSTLSLFPNLVFAIWPKDAFTAKNLDSAIDSLYGLPANESDAVKLKAPDIAENGAVVPVSVSTDLADVESISIYVEGNPNPLSATFELTKYTKANISTRIKMGKTSNVIAAIKAGGKIYTTRQEVKVTIGGCGG